jgi:hypothetical protein
MNNRTLINDELQSIAPVLVNASIAMPYTLPPDYFTQLAPTLLQAVHREDELPASFPNINKSNPYFIPAGYFEQFAQLVLRKIKEEETDASFFENLPKEMPYQVPQGYFEAFPALVLEKISVPKQQSVPEGYFDSLPDLMLAKVRQLDARKELDDVAPLLNTISRQPVQHVPQGYFDHLEALPFIAKQESNTPVVSIQKKKTSWFRYAAAACVAVMLSFGAYFVLKNKNEPLPSVANQPTVNVINQELASLDATTIESYLQKNSTGVVATSSISTDDLDELNDSDLDELLQEVPDQQLKKYLEEMPELPKISNQKKS